MSYQQGAAFPETAPTRQLIVSMPQPLGSLLVILLPNG